MERPDVGRVLRGLKDFQVQTVEHVFARMYTDPTPTRRFLIADEVGLGKTLVARGVTAKVIDHLWDSTPRIDVIYVCSNQDIARQNVARLNITGRDDYALASRITLLPLHVRDLKGRRLNFVSLTPSTSLELMEGTGQARERVLLYWLLADAWGLEGAAPRNVLADAVRADRFRDMIHRFDRDQVDADLAQAFQTRMRRDHDALRTRFVELCDVYKRSDSRVEREIQHARRALIGELRAVLAASCLEALEPDLIILDEFQRFKHLLHDSDDAGRLARELFEYGSAESQVRVLLLSATPYKMYTMHTEAADGGEDHYADFLRTTEFLLGSTEELAHCDALLKRYRRELLQLGAGNLAELKRTRDELETVLRRVMVRTERLAVREDRDGMLRTVPATVRLDAREPLSYVTYQRVADEAGGQDAIEYWKSAPYLLNFMEEYQLKQQFATAIEDPARQAGIARILGRGLGILLPWERVEAYRQVALPNARLRWLHDKTVGAGLWRLLWMPPSLPYYRLKGAWEDARDITKLLVFSSWHVVPRAAAALLSYDAERRMMLEREEAPINTAEARDRISRLLEFAIRDGRPDAMGLFTLLYPSASLAELGDVAAQRAEGWRYEDALTAVRSRIVAALEPILARHPSTGRPDEAWYWAAPVLLDLASQSLETNAWLDGHKPHVAWLGPEDEGGKEPSTEAGAGGGDAFAQHVAELRGAHQRKLGAPPTDLADVLIRVALASPAVCAYRALRRVSSATEDHSWLREAAARVAWAFRSLFNQPAVQMLVRGKTETRYWELVLDYCGVGCLQAVLDEYAHVLTEALGLIDQPAKVIATEVGSTIAEALSLRVSSIGVDRIECDGTVASRVAGRHAIRQQFAMRFGSEREEGTDGPSRPDLVRTAFNSPFWPFVLISTSVGQEGLDFHVFCHAVVHWNLPSNPVDLEQREGRVHRYKGHAVRKNVARMHGTPAEGEPAFVDLWRLAFERAAASRPAGTGDLMPYWVYPLKGGAAIERHVPALPLSRDARQFEALRRSLSVYRMAFGQPRQEDLVAHLLSRSDPEELALRLDAVGIRLRPQKGP